MPASILWLTRGGEVLLERGSEGAEARGEIRGEIAKSIDLRSARDGTSDYALMGPREVVLEGVGETVMVAVGRPGEEAPGHLGQVASVAASQARRGCQSDKPSDSRARSCAGAVSMLLDEAMPLMELQNSDDGIIRRLSKMKHGPS